MVQFSIDFSCEDAQNKAQAMTEFFKQAQQESTESEPAVANAQAYCLPSGQRPAAGKWQPASLQMRPPTGLFMKQGPQAVCCTYHAQARARPKGEEEFARWTLASITPVSPHSAVYHFTSADSTRGTPYKRGRGRTIWHKTWHTTVRIDGIERDYSPLSSWEQWDSGECDLLVGIRPWEEAGASFLHNQPLGSEVWLTKPKSTLSVPSLVHADQLKVRDPLAHAGVLLVLEGTGGLPAVAQILQHVDATTCFGKGAERMPPLQSPVHLIYVCERDDVLMTSELGRWCATQDPACARLRRLVLAIATPREHDGAVAFPQMTVDHAKEGLAELEKLDNVRILQGSSPLDGELLQAEMVPLRALGRCRVVLTGSTSFNIAVAGMLEAQCEVEPDAITMVEAPDSRPSVSATQHGP